MTTTIKPRWFQFRLRTLLVLMLLVCIGMGSLGVKMQQARKQRAAINAIVGGGGEVRGWSRHFAPTYQGWQRPSQDTPISWGGPPIYDGESRVHAWLRWLIGDDVFTHPISAIVVDNVGMEHLDRLPQLESLVLIDDQISDADLRYLKCLPRLTVVYISGDTFTDASLNYFTELTQLRKVYISSTKVSDSGVMTLQQALPDCEIHHNK